MRRLWPGRSLLVVAALYVASSRHPALAQAAPFDRRVILLDPAHGGADTGGHLGHSGQVVEEANLTLALADRLRASLAALGFRVVVTRTGNLETITSDQRAEIANRSHAVACIVLHASAEPTGVVLGTSPLGTTFYRTRMRGTDGAKAISWDRAQEAYVIQSDRLANQVGTALSRANLSTTLTRVAMRPLDSLTCPVISIELGSLSSSGSPGVLPSDASYQQRVAEVLAGALLLWSKEAQPPEVASLSWKGSR